VIEEGYDPAVPYHNSLHAASVMHGMHALLHLGGLADRLASVLGKDVDLIRMACLLAAAVHDYGHLGLNNDFLVKTMHERALRYNDEHANEHHHAAAALAVLSEPGCNFLDQLPKADFAWLRSLVIKLVLGTDMAEHGDIAKSLADLAAAEGKDMAKSAADKQARVLLQAAMKCADLGHLALEWEDHTQWVSFLEEEFFRQGDREEELGLEVSFLMDRSKPGVSKSQVWFFDNVVLPFFDSFASLVPAAEPLLVGVLSNRAQWQRLEESAAAEHARLVTTGVDVELSRATVAVSNAASSAGEAPRQRRSGRTRQRASKYWAGVRCRTPSPDIWATGA